MSECEDMSCLSCMRSPSQLISAEGERQGRDIVTFCLRPFLFLDHRPNKVEEGGFEEKLSLKSLLRACVRD